MEILKELKHSYMQRFCSPIDCTRWCRNYLDTKFDCLIFQRSGCRIILSAPIDFSSHSLLVAKYASGKYASEFKISMKIPLTFEGDDTFDGNFEVQFAYDSPVDFDVKVNVVDLYSQSIKEFISTSIQEVREIFLAFREDLIACNVYEEPDAEFDYFTASTVLASAQFSCNSKDIYRALLDPDRIVAWSRSLPIIAPFPPQIGGSFILYGGAISGKLIEVIENSRILQLWRHEGWIAGYYAQVEFLVREVDVGVKVVVNCTGVKLGDEALVREMLEQKYFAPIKRVFCW